MAKLLKEISSMEISLKNQQKENLFLWKVVAV